LYKLLLKNKKHCSVWAAMRAYGSNNRGDVKLLSLSITQNWQILGYG